MHSPPGYKTIAHVINVVTFKVHVRNISTCSYDVFEGSKEMFYLTTHSTHFILQLYDVGHLVKEGRKEIFYLTTHSTHFILGYMTSDIW